MFKIVTHMEYILGFDMSEFNHFSKWLNINSYFPDFLFCSMGMISIPGPKLKCLDTYKFIICFNIG